jgi:hypothetical protein
MEPAMAKTIGRDVQRPQTVSAYQRAAAMGVRPHLVDAREQPRFWRPPVGGGTVRPAEVGARVDGATIHVKHGVEAPLRTSFGLGLGFAAGAWTFRVVVQLLFGGALLLALWGVVSRVLH